MKCQNNSFLGWIWSWAHPPLQDWCLWCCVGEGSSGRRTWVLPPGGGQRYGSWRPTLEPGTRSAWAPWGRCQPPGRGHREASSQCSGNTPTEPEPGRPAEDEDRGTRDEKRGRWREGGGVRREGGGEREEGWEEREEERGRRDEKRGRRREGGGRREKEGQKESVQIKCDLGESRWEWDDGGWEWTERRWKGRGENILFNKFRKIRRKSMTWLCGRRLETGADDRVLLHRVQQKKRFNFTRQNV